MRLQQEKVITIILFLAALSFSTAATVNGESPFEVESMNLTVYRDGLVHAKQTLVVNEIYPEVVLPLLSSSAKNIIVLDENQTAVDYETNGLNLTVFTLGAKQILIEYDTIALTMKEAETWTLVVDNPYNLTVFLPKNSTVIYLSQMPTAINTEGTGITMSLYPGHWEISYVIPLHPQDEQESPNGVSPSIPNEYLFAAGVAAAVAALLAFIFVRRRRKPSVEKILKAYPQLMTEDKDVLEFLVEKNGKAFEAEIRERFPEMPRTTLWRLVRRLERLEIVEVKKIGLENQVALKK
jgi:uncharacterized membrane protein